MPTLPFHQVDVFSTAPFKGNPLAVIAEADGLDDAAMQAIANWTNLSETTFLSRAQNPGADYRVRIFTPQRELPFAGHPTLGSCHVWLALGGRPQGEHVVQECGAGLVRIKRDGARLAFTAPPLRRSGAVDAELTTKIAAALGIKREAMRAVQWADNGPGWIGVLLDSRQDLLNIKFDVQALSQQPIGVVAPWDPTRDGGDAQFEVRAFMWSGAEDPVTGSLNASLAQWLIGAGIAPKQYIAAQGTLLGRAGRVHVIQEGETIWIGGDVAPVVKGTISL
ncbi:MULTISPECIES: PhzF family phenazine biosynthesis protein [Bradyrhizobium]|jgi:PhzF family phenazine biosynthesis protein|uniref:PhzF family phenazine biosynthesis protein n=1 Tax=Bradyrhizobium TaxID=374 RepID=UPI0003A0C324|nr:PhzF family phenazine biosynthesis protein [Bradyrhizobium denitrificans]MCL8488929.1 PhzF family phenazine biosynthesis protein [Bradyrhizobium denitrificans]RTL91975.1 MAG: PhzF family phenazine biosynthesis protein [Bradyrhizobiaceae bacterium]